ncbi:DsrE/DsrF/DrsH-like family protein [Neobacillus rhizosphaerae]|uniref:DsrE/DsrF/DrsH-like family protein n=1 Tax=Neobacillus rhizosphaerae TaxID=2880965 RepID=UPI003D2BAEEE
MTNKRLVYFVSLSSNAPFVLKEALHYVSQGNEVSVFFDLDGARVLDPRYFKTIENTHNMDIGSLLTTALSKGIKLYGCQLNVLMADGFELVDGAELAGVATFLDIAYKANAVLSY